MSSNIPHREAVANVPSKDFPRIYGLHHVAYRCRDSEETRHFYEDLLKLPLVGIVTHDSVPSTGEYCPYFHLFFEMADGSCLAFFDLFDGKVTAPDPQTPRWVNHIALQVGSEQELLDAKARLEAEGIDVLGETTHASSKAIYFFDPNGIRLELAYTSVSKEALVGRAQRAHAILADRGKVWNEVQRRAAEAKAQSTGGTNA